MNRFEKISELLFNEIDERFNKEPTEIFGLDFSENFTEMLERFIILHIRTWKMEDAVAEAKTDSEIGALKKKIDYCFKHKRPQLIRAMNSYLDSHISSSGCIKMSEGNIKLYRGWP